MDPLLEDPQPLVSDVRPIIIVVEEDQPGDPRVVAENGVVTRQDVRPARVSLRAVGRAGAIAVFADDDGLVRERPMDRLEVSAHRLHVSPGPGLVIFVPLDEVHLPGHVALGRRLQGIRGVRTQPPRVETLGLPEHPPDESLGDRVLAVDLVAQAPGKDAGVVAVPGDHLAELLEAVLGDLLEQVPFEPREGARAPGRHFDLDEDPLPVAIVEDPAVLLPVDARENAVELLQVVVVMVDPGPRFGHAEGRVTPAIRSTPARRTGSPLRRNSVPRTSIRRTPKVVDSS